MRYLLFVASPSQSQLVAESLLRIGSKPVESTDPTGSSFILQHRQMGDLTLHIHVLNSIESVTPHLRKAPVDMLIYDERGKDGIEATQALERLRDHVASLSRLWGPDFLFPLRRAVAILDGKENAARRAFQLGRDHVRDVLVAPKNLGQILRWLAKLILHDEKNKPHIGLGLSGGGIEGFLYQAGCLYALEKAMTDSRSIYQCDLYSGISSGSILATLAANQIPLREVIRSIYGKSKILKSLNAQVIFDPALSSISSRLLRQAFKRHALDANDFVDTVLRAVPTGLFKGDGMKAYFERILSTYGRHGDYASCPKSLLVGATDQDTFEHVVFSRESHPDMPMSIGVRASCALPPFFTPVTIQGRHYIDGQITKTINLEEMVRRGCRLIMISDPLQPYATMIPGSLDREGGIFALIQTVKALVYSRFKSSLKHLTDRYPEVDFIVFQPSPECGKFMAGSPMRFRLRKQIVELAYKGTLHQLMERNEVYSAKLGKFGLELKDRDALKRLEKRGLAI